MKLRIYAAAMALLAAGGCATPPPKKAGPAPRPVVLAQFARRLADGRLYVAANLKNTSAVSEPAVVSCAFNAGAAPAPVKIELSPGEILTVHFEAASAASSEASITVTP